ncbi:MFS transporter [Pseudaeromonas pectinilytica]
MHDDRMTGRELRATWGLGLLFALRMLGMFMVLPVLTTYGHELPGATPALIGIAIGVYGFTQALCQIPLGFLSDRQGRRLVIVGGLLLFALGSVVAALADSIWGIILGRSLQGAGAISAAVMALLSDLTREQHRSKAMAIIGMSFGVTFAVAMIVGPILARSFGVSFLFWAIAALAILAIGVVLFLVPQPAAHQLDRESALVSSGVLHVLTRPRLLRLNLGIFCLHVLLMSSFIALPEALESAGMVRTEQWQAYLWTMLISFLPVLPIIIYAEKFRRMRRVFLGTILLLFGCELMLWGAGSEWVGLLIGMQLFFIAFNLMEALLPSLVSKEAPAGFKGTAMGIYSTAQFLGVGVGGSLGGYLLGMAGSSVVFLFAAMLALLWWLIARPMPEPAYVKSIRLALPAAPSGQLKALQLRLQQQPGVQEVAFVAQEQAAFIKVDTRETSRLELEALVAAD